MKRYLMAASASLFLTLVIAPSKAMAIPLKTKEEIISFQKDHGLKPDGIIGKKTRAVIRAESKKKNSNTVNIPIENDPVTPAVSVNRVTFRPKKIVKIEEKCQFLFWELECSKSENIKPNTTRVVEKGLTMVGMDVKTDRKELEKKFANALGYKVDPARIPWCAAWANTVLADTGITGTNSLTARSFLDWGESVKNPSQGDIVVMSRGRSKWAGHVGFYMNTVTLNGKQYVAVLGGNQGKGVNIAYYPASKVLGYRKPVQA